MGVGFRRQRLEVSARSRLRLHQPAGEAKAASDGQVMPLGTKSGEEEVDDHPVEDSSMGQQHRLDDRDGQGKACGCD